MRSALIGHTGFVGGSLLRAAAFDRHFNSKNIEEIDGRSFGLVVCAGVSAVKWQANRAPEADQAGIARLIAALNGAEIEELVLISTIDVYPAPGEGGDEGTEIDPSRNHSYGRHRTELERWCARRFPAVRIVRLPALFGPGLRKNAIFDLMHGNMVQSINPAGVFQWYPLRRLWTDIGIARREGLAVTNLFPEPLSLREIIEAAFPGAETGAAVEPAPRYDMQTRHGRLFGGDDRYIMDRGAAMTALLAFVREEMA